MMMKARSLVKMVSMDFLYSPVSLAATFLSLGLTVFAICVITSKIQEKHGKNKKRYHPIAGTMLNQLMNFNRLHHYMTDLARKHKTYRLISPFRSEVYTSDPANVEYILKTNFENYGKVCTDSFGTYGLLLYSILHVFLD